MTPVALFAAVLGVACAPVPAEAKSMTTPAALVKKLHGTWDSRGPCDGALTLKADGAYEWVRHGPAGNTSGGTWAVRWDALPPTLVLTCTTSDDRLYVRTTEVKLVRLDDEVLALQSPAGKTPVRYERAKK